MIIILIILVVLVVYFISRPLIKKDIIYIRQNKDGSYNASISPKYVKKKLNKLYFENLQCPRCRLQSDKLNWFEFCTSDDSWGLLAGSQGFYANVLSVIHKLRILSQ